MRKELFKTYDQMYYVLDSPKSKQWIGYMSIKLDLEYVKELISIIKKKATDYEKSEDDKFIEKSIWVSSVITYCKCFTDASSGRKVSLEKKHIFKNNQALSSFHDEIMEMRHNYIAHAGQSSFEQLEPRIRLAQRQDGFFYPHLVFEGYTLTGFDVNVVDQFLNIVDSTLAVVKVKIEKLGRLVLEEEAESKDEVQMLELMKKQFEIDSI